MTFVLFVIALVPLALLAGIALPRAANRLQFTLSTLALGGGLLFAWLVFPWHLVSLWYRQLLPVLFLAAVVIGFRRIRAEVEAPVPRWQRWFNGGLSLAMIGLFG